MHKSWEIAVTGVLFIMLVVPVVAGIYVGATSTKADHHGPKPVKHAEAAHVAGIEAAAGEAPVVGYGDEHHPAPGMVEGHAPIAGTTPEAPMEADHLMPPAHQECAFQDMVGLKADTAVFEKLRAAHKVYRVLKKDSVMTMDHSPDRINLNVDDHDVITAVTCG